MKLFGDRLRGLREDRDLKQQDVAKDLFISNKVLSSYECNVAFPSIELLKRICEYYNVSTDYLLQIDLKRRKAEPPNNEQKIPVLNIEQLKLLVYYDRLNEEQRDAVKGLMVLYHTENQICRFHNYGVRYITMVLVKKCVGNASKRHQFVTTNIIHTMPITVLADCT